MPSYQNILVAIDTGQPTHPELDQALRLARQSHGHLHLVDSVKDLHSTIRLLAPQWQANLDELASQKQAALESLTEQTRQSGVPTSCELLRGNYSQALLRVIEQRGIDLVIRAAKGTHSRESGTLGATSRQLLLVAPCDVWLTQGSPSPQSQRILAAIDATPDDAAHSELNRSILQQARELAESTASELHVLYVWDLFGTALLETRMSSGEFDELIAQNQRYHQTKLDQTLSEFGLSSSDTNVHLQRGEPANVIPEFCDSREIELLVCGTVARRGMSNLMLGNTVLKILSRLSCAVLTLKPKAWIETDA